MREKLTKLYPSGWTYSGWRTFFLVAALWNILAAIPASLWPEHNLKAYYGVLYGSDYAIILNRSFWLAVLIFGIGYYLVSRAPEKNLGIIIMGILGKVAVAINWYILVFTGMATAMAFVGATGDSVFTVYFIYYLMSGPREADAPA